MLTLCNSKRGASVRRSPEGYLCGAGKCFDRVKMQPAGTITIMPTVIIHRTTFNSVIAASIAATARYAAAADVRERPFARRSSETRMSCLNARLPTAQSLLIVPGDFGVSL